MTLHPLIVLILSALAMVGLGAISRAFMPKKEKCSVKGCTGHSSSAMDHAAADRLYMASILMLATLNKHGANRVKAEQELRAAGEAYDKFRGRP